MTETVVKQAEEYVKQVMKDMVNHHDFKHVDRVRNWAVQIAKEEGFEELDLVEIAALMHDISLAYDEDRSLHGEKGAEIAGRYLRENKLLPEEQINRITEAIKYHSGGNISDNRLLDILQDADCLEAFGAIGIMWAYTSRAAWPEYNPENIKGTMWGKCGEKYQGVFLDLPEEKTIIEQINLQIHYYDNLTTGTAKRLAEPLVKYMKDFILQLESEILSGRVCD